MSRRGAWLGRISFSDFPRKLFEDDHRCPDASTPCRIDRKVVGHSKATGRRRLVNIAGVVTCVLPGPQSFAGGGDILRPVTGRPSHAVLRNCQRLSGGGPNQDRHLKRPGSQDGRMG